MGTKTTISWEEFLAAAKEGQKSELVDGEIIRMTPVHLLHEAILKRLMRYLDRFCDSHPEWDWYPSNATFTMVSGNWRCPDASLVRRQRFPLDKPLPARADFAPDIAFEIYSPGDSASQTQRKRQDYQESGVIQVWIDPEKRLVELAYPDRPLEYFDQTRPLVIRNLPGFSLDLKTLFSL